MMITIVVQTDFLTVQTQFPMYWSEKKKDYTNIMFPVTSTLRDLYI